jgi:hypothetical protein
MHKRSRRKKSIKKARSKRRSPKMSIKTFTKFNYDSSISYNDILPHLDKIKFIEGPVRYIVLTPTNRLEEMLGRNPPLIVCLGDIHQGNDVCKNCDEQSDDQEGCYTLYGNRITENNKDLLGYFDQLGKKFKVDFFFEEWKSKLWRKEVAVGLPFILTPHKNSALAMLVSRIPTCAIKKELFENEKNPCPYKFMNVHYVDIRKNFDDNGILNVIESGEAEKYLKTSSNLDFIDLYDNIDGLIDYMKVKDFKFKKFINIIQSVYKDIDPEELLDLMILRFTVGANTFFKRYFRENPIMKKYSKVHKQISQLPEDLQELMYTYSIRTMDQKFFTEYEELINSDMETKYESIMYLLEMSHQIDINWFGLSGVDLYYIARTLKVPTGGSPTQLSLVYLGDGHINFIGGFLLKHGLYKIHLNIKNRDDNKCIRI